jgi:hypothetical protein
MASTSSKVAGGSFAGSKKGIIPGLINSISLNNLYIVFAPRNNVTGVH